MSQLQVSSPKEGNKIRYLCQYFDEDLVCRVTPGGHLQVGMVVKSCEDSSESDDDDDDDDAGFSDRKLEQGKTEVAWYPKGNRQILSEKKVELFDRSLLPGDVVKHLNVEGGQRGYVCDSNVKLTLKVVGTNQVINNVDCKEFICATDLTEDVLFYYRNWIGYIEETKCRVILSTQDGSLLSLREEDLCEFEDITSERTFKSEFDDTKPYPGQTLVGSKYILQDGDFIHSTDCDKHKLNSSRKSKVTLTVEQVVTDEVEVHWLCCISEDTSKLPNKLVHQPPRIIQGKDVNEIVQLHYFQRGNTEMADRGIYVMKSGDEFMSISEWSLKMANNRRCQKLGIDQMDAQIENDSDQYVDVSSDENELCSTKSETSNASCKRKLSVAIRRIRRKVLKPSRSRNFVKCAPQMIPGNRIAVEVVATETFVDVVWQDGSKEKNISSSNFYPVHHLDEHEFFPGDFVVRSSDEFCFTKYGVVDTVDHSQRTAKVKWLNVLQNQAPELESEEEVSVYDIQDHPDYHLRPGSCVIRLVNEKSEHLPPMARAGQVVALKPMGFLECVWADGSRSDVTPQELYIIGDYDSDDIWADGISFGNDSFSDTNSNDYRTPPTSPKPEAEASISISKESQKELVDRLRKSLDSLEDWFVQYPTVNNQNGHNFLRKLTSLMENLKTVNEQMDTALMDTNDIQALLDSVRLPENVMGRTSHINRLIGQLARKLTRRSSVGNESPGEPAMEVGEDAPHDVTSSPVSTKTKVGLEILQKLKVQLFSVCQSSDSNENLTALENPDNENSFQHAPQVPDTHRFKLSLFQPGNSRVFFSRIKKEIELLRSSLPKDILVKGYEDRMDLFSVLIKGPVDTPYEDGIFLFDLQLPSGYPSVPPLVNYIPFCRDRLNPNLYESGKVCVSLLGTWSGKGSEVWSPLDSNLLQLLISIQGLILVPEPYYNEAGYTRQKGTSSGDENSRLYNEMAVVKVVESMTKMASSPPEPFKQEILAHIKQTSGPFASRLDKWIKFSQSSNSVPDPGDMKLGFPLLPASKGFCLSLLSALASYRKTVESINLL